MTGWKLRRYELEEEFALRRGAAWQLLADTDHLNRHIGLFPVDFGPLQADGEAMFREGKAKVAGLIPLTVLEYPFEWEKYRSYSVMRVYPTGPLRRFFGGCELRDGPTRLSDGSRSTIVRLFAEFTPANAAGVLGIPVIGRRSMRKTMEFLRRAAARMETAGAGAPPSMADSSPPASSPSALPPPAATATGQVRLASDRRRKLRQLVDALRKVPVGAAGLAALERHLLEESDDEVLYMRPYELARKWGIDREEALRLFLHAASAGLLNMSWHLICPNCRVSKRHAGTLSGVEPVFHCDFCAIDYNADNEDVIELRFSVHPAVREARHEVYCVGGPGLTNHIVGQIRIAAGETGFLTMPGQEAPETGSGAGAYRVRVLKENDSVAVNPGSPDSAAGPGAGRPAVEWSYAEDGWSVNECALPPSAPIAVHNRLSRDIWVVLEHASRDPDAVTISRASRHAEFRRLFSSEVLAPGMEVGINSVTILFSDLYGSTSYYEAVGDAEAYGKVRKHFDFLTARIEENGGALVKTIGDAVMAVFDAREQGLRAALSIQSGMDEWNRAVNPSAPFVIKLGLHAGQAISVQANGKLDYFGRTVNMAARIQSASVGGDIVVSADWLRDESVCGILSGCGAPAELFAAGLKGFGDDVPLARIRCPR